MPLRTDITRLFGIRHPIVQGGLNYAGSAELSAAVANAGGLGMLSAHRQPSASALRAEIRRARAMLAPDCPGDIGVNMTLLPEFEERVDYGACIDTLGSEGVGVVETSGPLRPGVADALLANGTKIIHKCDRLRDARRAEAMGVHAISLDGFECAGQPTQDELGNWVLQALGARELSVPFVASGGVGCGRQLAAALALGASGVSMGTRFIATREASAMESSMKGVLVGRDAGRAALGLLHSDGSSLDARPHGVRLSVWSSGSVVALIDDVPTCRELIERLVAEATDAIHSASACVDGDDDDR